mmetsp:Transcript_98791/g.195872  ORF Transcript_98791/g.195872 Transcript_98791/m.195872 type:complete len:137 (+) Transcript_98791:3983-4393(+)
MDAKHLGEGGVTGSSVAADVHQRLRLLHGQWLKWILTTAKVTVPGLIASLTGLEVASAVASAAHLATLLQKWRPQESYRIRLTECTHERQAWRVCSQFLFSLCDCEWWEFAVESQHLGGCIRDYGGHRLRKLPKRG